MRSQARGKDAGTETHQVITLGGRCGEGPKGVRRLGKTEAVEGPTGTIGEIGKVVGRDAHERVVLVGSVDSVP